MKMQHAQSNRSAPASDGASDTLPQKTGAIHPLRRAARHLAEVGAGKSRTREIVGVLMTHAARSRRVALPATSIRLRVHGPMGRSAIGLRV
ncbi:hypothetical protein B7H23_08210 [Notoacmeibacter marinus]|uniref:Uncharacterized protein n=1 Tax=Notoacmeibacter marinus TaxID=1876515 RepID=A0A231UWC9_9HYPH|nr:hypothetical protein [Notoacmeibacter marinus]OXT00157.1 hypothetical protein B7H23_08210 [Notoacmeibacter marinus]